VTFQSDNQSSFNLNVVRDFWRLQKRDALAGSCTPPDFWRRLTF
jgi:hypothetical protein